MTLPIHLSSDHGARGPKTESRRYLVTAFDRFTFRVHDRYRQSEWYLKAHELDRFLDQHNLEIELSDTPIPAWALAEQAAIYEQTGELISAEQIALGGGAHNVDRDPEDGLNCCNSAQGVHLPSCENRDV